MWQVGLYGNASDECEGRPGNFMFLLACRTCRQKQVERRQQSGQVRDRMFGLARPQTQPERSFKRCSRTVSRPAGGNVLRFAVDRPATRRTHVALLQDCVGACWSCYYYMQITHGRRRGRLAALTCCASSHARGTL
jgi:hypothetical protein